jgi:predicted transcriptional regulator
MLNLKNINEKALASQKMTLFSKELKNYLMANNLSVMKFSTLLKIHLCTVYRWLDGSQLMTKKSARKVERVTKKFFTVDKICELQNTKLDEQR